MTLQVSALLSRASECLARGEAEALPQRLESRVRAQAVDSRIDVVEKADLAISLENEDAG